MPKFLGNSVGPEIKVVQNVAVGEGVYNNYDVYTIQNTNSWPGLGSMAIFTIISGPYDEQGLVINLAEQPFYAYRFQELNTDYVIRFNEAIRVHWDLVGGGARGGNGGYPNSPSTRNGENPVGNARLQFAGDSNSTAWELTANRGYGGTGGTIPGTWGQPGQPGNYTPAPQIGTPQSPAHPTAGRATVSSGTYNPYHGGNLQEFRGNVGYGGDSGGNPNYGGQPGTAAPSVYPQGQSPYPLPNSYNGYGGAGSSPGLGGGGGGGGGGYWFVEDHLTSPGTDYTINVGAKAAAIVRIDEPT